MRVDLAWGGMGSGPAGLDRGMDDQDPTEPVTVYWRPGCPFCMRLRRGLRKAGIGTTDVDIWSDPEAAAVVRGFAGGNETVPTVVVAGRGLVNPSVAEVRAALVAAGGPAEAVEGAGRPARVGVRHRIAELIRPRD